MGAELISMGPAEGWPLNVRGSVSFGRVLLQEKSLGSTLGRFISPYTDPQCLLGEK